MYQKCMFHKLAGNPFKYVMTVCIKGLLIEFGSILFVEFN